MSEREEVMKMSNLDRELLAVAEAMSGLGYWVKIENHVLPRVTVYRDGFFLGLLQFPPDEEAEPPRIPEE